MLIDMMCFLFLLLFFLLYPHKNNIYHVHTYHRSIGGIVFVTTAKQKKEYKWETSNLNVCWLSLSIHLKFIWQKWYGPINDIYLFPEMWTMVGGNRRSSEEQILIKLLFPLKETIINMLHGTQSFSKVCLWLRVKIGVLLASEHFYFW